MMNDSFLDKSESHTEREGFTPTDLDEEKGAFVSYHELGILFYAELGSSSA